MICNERETEIEQNLKYAAIIQAGILPKERHFERLFKDWFLISEPLHYVSGDFYWVAKKDDLIYLAVGDCTGHGFSASMLSVLTNSLLDYAILNKDLKRTNKILNEIDKRFVESFSSNELEQNYDNDWVDISLVCIDPIKKRLFFSGAKRKILFVQKHKTQLIEGDGFSIGAWQVQKERNYSSFQTSYEEGDIIYLGSDGYQDQMGLNGRKYQSRKLHDLLQRISPLPMKAQKELLIKEISNWRGDFPQTDDITLIGLRL